MIGTPIAEAKRSKGSSSRSSYSSSKKSYKSSRGSYKSSKGSYNSSGSSSSNINSSTSSGSTSSSSNYNNDTSWKEKISSVSRSDLKYSSPYSGSSYQPSGNYNYSKYSGKPYYKSSSGFATTLLTAAGTYFVLSHFFGPDPVYVNAETGEEIDIDDYGYEDLQAVEVETEATLQEEESVALEYEEDLTNESMTALIPEENTETTESATTVTKTPSSTLSTNETIQEEVEEESPFSGLLGLAIIVGIWMYVRNRKKKRRA